MNQYVLRNPAGLYLTEDSEGKFTWKKPQRPAARFWTRQAADTASKLHGGKATKIASKNVFLTDDEFRVLAQAARDYARQRRTSTTVMLNMVGAPSVLSLESTVALIERVEAAAPTDGVAVKKPYRANVNRKFTRNTAKQDAA